MYIQWKYKSFYKLRNVVIQNEYYTPDSIQNSIKTPSLSLIFLTLFFKKLIIIEHYKPAQASKIVNNCNTSFFFLPRTKKVVIFLRAPYKNKLARLNILRNEYTSICSIKTHQKINSQKYNMENLPMLFKFVYALLKFNFSTTKLKQVKTTVSFNITLVSNYTFCNFN